MKNLIFILFFGFTLPISAVHTGLLKQGEDTSAARKAGNGKILQNPGTVIWEMENAHPIHLLPHRNYISGCASFREIASSAIRDPGSTGRKVNESQTILMKTLVDKWGEKGEWVTPWVGRGLNSNRGATGFSYYKFRYVDFEIMKKMIIKK